MSRFDTSVITRTLDESDYAPLLGSAWMMVWGRGQTPEQMEKLAEEYEGKIKVVKLNTQENQQVPSNYGIVSIPTFLLIKGGEVQETIIGSQPLQAIKAKIDPHLG